MPLLILALGILGAAVAFAGFLAGEPGDRKLKDKLIAFYVAVEDGNWNYLYRYPAAALLAFMGSIFGTNPWRPRYLGTVLFLSVAMTLILFFMSITYSYALAAATETRCRVPDLARFLQIPGFMSTFLIHILVINVAFDYVAWTVSQYGLRILQHGSSRSAVLMLVGVPVFALCLIWTMYLIYLPLTIKIQANEMGIASFGWRQFLQIMQANVANVAQLFHVPGRIFSIDCSDPNHSMFSITEIGTMQILALETLTPAILLLISSAFGVLAFSTRRFTKPMVGLLIRRLQEHPGSIGALLGGGLLAVAALLTAIQKFRGQ